MANKNIKQSISEVDNTKTLSELYHELMAFYANSHVPTNVDDVKGLWIVSKEEQDALKVVLDVLVDCGADENFYEKE